MNTQNRLQRRLEQERTTTKLQRQQLKDYEERIQEKDATIEQLRQIIVSALGHDALPDLVSQRSKDHNKDPTLSSQEEQWSTPLRSVTNTPTRQCPTGPIRRTCDPDASHRQNFWSPYLSSPSAPTRIRTNPRPFDVPPLHSNRSDDHATEAYPFEEVVRARHERAKLTGSTCPCCAPFFASNKTYHDEEGTLTSADQIQRFSRHRQKFERPRTPPGFWDVGFPSSEPDHE